MLFYPLIFPSLCKLGKSTLMNQTYFTQIRATPIGDHLWPTDTWAHNTSNVRIRNENKPSLLGPNSPLGLYNIT